MVKLSSPLFVSPSSWSPVTRSIQALWEAHHCHRFSNRLWDHGWKYPLHQVSSHWVCVWVWKTLLSIRRTENFGLFTDISFTTSSPWIYFRLWPSMGVLAISMWMDVWDAETDGQKSIKGQSESVSRNTVSRTIQSFTICNTLMDNSTIAMKSHVP